jgi:hypothetical protein
MKAREEKRKERTSAQQAKGHGEKVYRRGDDDDESQFVT